jgi:ubiquinone/menaquinone biosynthesis C-methylase UbiE
MANFLTQHLQIFWPVYEKVSESYKTLKRKGYAIKRVAKRKAIQFLQGNAESTSLPDESFDLVTVMWAFHEAPLQGRDRILKEARRLLSPGGILAVIDISSDYVPSKTMLQGEPYVQEYQQNIHNQLQHIRGFKKPQFRSIVDNHLSMWTLTRSASVA